SSRRRHTRSKRDWSSDVCSSDLPDAAEKDPESYKKKSLAWIRAKAGRLFRDKIVGDSNYKLCWVQHPLSGVWIRAGELKGQLSRSEERRVGKECRSGRGRRSENK